MSSTIGPVRTRLNTQQRREQLLTIGTKLFAARPYEDVWIDEVAEIAGVSRGLLYHYFATKRDFFEAVVIAQADHLLAVTEPDASLSLTDGLMKGLDAYLDFVETNPDGYRVLHRAAASVDEGIQRICQENLLTQQERIVTILLKHDTATAATRLAVHGWLHFAISASLRWVEHPSISRNELRDMFARTLISAARIDLGPQQVASSLLPPEGTSSLP